MNGLSDPDNWELVYLAGTDEHVWAYTGPEVQPWLLAADVTRRCAEIVAKHRDAAGATISQEGYWVADGIYRDVVSEFGLPTMECSTRQNGSDDASGTSD